MTYSCTNTHRPITAIQLHLLTSPSWFILMSISILPLTEPNPPYSGENRANKTWSHQSCDWHMAYQQTSSVIVIATSINLSVIIG